VERTLTARGGASLYLNDLGPRQAPALVVLHGGPAAHHDYLLPAFATLADERRVVLYDQRGGGRSRVDGAQPPRLDDHLDDLDAVLADVGGADVIGYSFGGLLAMLHAARRPGRTRRLILASSAPPHHGYRKALERALAAAQASPWVVAERQALERSDLRHTLPEEYRRRRFGLSVAGYFADPRLCYGLTPFRMQANAADALRAELGDHDFRDEVAALDGTRVLFVHGDRDPIDATLLEEAARSMGARFERVTGAGHVPYLEAPEAFFSILRGFLGAST
jgi:proline iminopeptidase